MVINYNQIYFDGIKFHNNINPFHLPIFDIYDYNDLFEQSHAYVKIAGVFLLIKLIFYLTDCKVSVMYFNVLFSLTCFSCTTGLSNLTYFNDQYGYKCDSLSWITLVHHRNVEFKNDNTIAMFFLIISILLTIFLFNYAKIMGNELKSGSILKSFMTLYILLSGLPFFSSILMLNPRNILSFVFEIERIIIKFFTNEGLSNLSNLIFGQDKKSHMANFVNVFKDLNDTLGNLCYKNYIKSPTELLSILDKSWFYMYSQCFDLYSFITLSYKVIIVLIIIMQIFNNDSGQDLSKKKKKN